MADQQWANDRHAYIGFFCMESNNFMMSLFPPITNSQYKHKIK